MIPPIGRFCASHATQARFFQPVTMSLARSDCRRQFDRSPTFVNRVTQISTSHIISPQVRFQ